MQSTVTQVSEREMVINYLWRRCKVAFRRGADEEAQKLHRFATKLEGMTDAEYSEGYD